MTQKYVMASPLYRMEQEFHRQGLELSRQTMANWLLDSADLWLKPIYECLHKKLLAQEVLHADETTLQVLHEEGRRPQNRYLTYVLQLAPTLDQSEADWVEKLLPENAPENCKANYREK